MVSTRHHPRPFPDPGTPATVTRSSAPSSPLKSSFPIRSDDSLTVSSTATARKRRSYSSTHARTTSSSARLYNHKVPPLLVIWLYISLPLVIWDAGYVALRPHSMPGGKLHSPVWTPYGLYGTVDYIYGWPAWKDHNGFTAAQTSLNVVETVMYFYYLFVISRNGAKGLPGFQDIQGFFLGDDDKFVRGPRVASAVLCLFSAAVMTVSKTVLYWLNEYFSGFANIGHNSAYNLVLLWIIPNGLWLVLPTYIIKQSGQRQQRDTVDDITQAARLAVKCPKQYVSSAVSPQRGMSLLLMPYSHAVSTIAITVMLTGVYHSQVPIQIIPFRMYAIEANSGPLHLVPSSFGSFEYHLGRRTGSFHATTWSEEAQTGNAVAAAAGQQPRFGSQSSGISQTLHR